MVVRERIQHWYCQNNIDISGVLTIYYYWVCLWRIIVGVLMVNYCWCIYGVSLSGVSTRCNSMIHLCSVIM